MAEATAALPGVKPQHRSKLSWTFRDCGVLVWRSISHIIKNPDQLASVVVQPIMFMLLFRYVFGGAIETQGTSYVNFLVPGIIIQTAAFGSTYTALGVANDLQRGIIDRFKSLPMFSAAVLVGHTTADLVRNTVSSMVMLAVAFAVGFRPTAGVAEWVAAVGILLLFTYAISWLSAILGMVAKSVEAVQWISFVAVFPLTFASSAFVPTASMPGVLRTFAENQPVTHVIEALRGLLIGTPSNVGYHATWAIIWCVGILAISVPLTAWMFRRHTSR